jgi:hypothetical protein
MKVREQRQNVKLQIVRPSLKFDLTDASDEGTQASESN